MGGIPVLTLGLETSDDLSFFSLNDRDWRSVSEILSEEYGDNKTNKKILLKMHSATGILDLQEEISEHNITRKHSFCAEENSLLLDFVSRYAFPKSLFGRAYIGGKTIKHSGFNIYHQFPTDQARLEGDWCSVDIRILGTQTGDAFHKYLYVRDEPGKWVVHARLLPIKRSHIITKLNTSWYNRALPQWLHNIMFYIPGLSSILLYRGERKNKWSFLRKIIYKILPLSSYPLAHIKRGDSINIISSCSFSLKNNQSSFQASKR